MDKFIIEPTLTSPRVFMDPEKNQFEFSGESRPENVRNFYMPILQWLEKYAEEISDKDSLKQSAKREFNFNLEYFNSTSAKYILDIFKILNSIHERGQEIHIRWHYEEDDEDMLEVGKEMARMAKLPFEYVRTDG